AVLARMVAYAQLDVEFAPRAHAAIPFGESRAEIVAMNQPTKRKRPVAGGERPPGEAFPPAIDMGVAVAIERPHDVRDRVDDRPHRTEQPGPPSRRLPAAVEQDRTDHQQPAEREAAVPRFGARR